MDELKKYIKEQLKQKQKPKDIIASLVTNGYPEKESKRKVYTQISLNYIILSSIVLVCFLVIAFLGLAVYYQSTIKIITLNNTFSESPKDWIIHDEKKSDIDIKSITHDNSYYEGMTQVYDIPFTDKTTIFELSGYYKGNYFDEEYLNGNKTLMKISSSLNPDDGIIEGIIIERINDYKTNNISAFIFVDSDWKNAIPNTKITWGVEYQYSQDFAFNEISNGIYMTEIYDDPYRHFENFSISFGGIFVGDITNESILNDDFENKTFIRLYS